MPNRTRLVFTEILTFFLYIKKISDLVGYTTSCVFMYFKKFVSFIFDIRLGEVGIIKYCTPGLELPARARKHDKNFSKYMKTHDMV